jgi:nanoRNase/pAp phosphatase (c-di-AMP/oligoRNAs hydrolase)
LREHARLRTLLKKANAILIVGHQNSDPDAVCSAYALSALARQVNRKLKVSFASPDGVSKLSKQILKVIPLEVTDDPELSAADLIVTVDTNTLQQLGPLKEPVLNSAKPIVMIDHHAPHPENAKTAALVVCDEDATSTCEMILEMYVKFRVSLSSEVSQALMIGMLVETGHMSIGTRRTFKSACLLIEAGADPESAFAATRTTMDESERIARIKTAQRVRLEHMGRWVIALSEVGSYHASAARGLVALGAHLAVVAGKRNDELTLSFRSTRDFAEGTGMHLGSDLAAPLGNRLEGMGGGHATAAGANVRGSVNEALRIAFEIVKDFISRHPKSNRSEAAYEGASSRIGVTTQE